MSAAFRVRPSVRQACIGGIRNDLEEYRAARGSTRGCVKAKDTRGRPLPYFGYYYRLLRAQGADAPGGAYDYVVRGKMIGGFALVAYPGNCGNSGVMTFIVNHDGVVYQKDLGPDTAAAARAITRFDPDNTWTRL
jgi:hypothetical protein